MPNPFAKCLPSLGGCVPGSSAADSARQPAAAPPALRSRSTSFFSQESLPSYETSVTWSKRIAVGICVLACAAAFCYSEQEAPEISIVPVLFALGLVLIGAGARRMLRDKAVAKRGKGRPRQASVPGVLALPDELATINKVRAALRRPPNAPTNLIEDDDMLTVQLLRFVREHGLRADKVEGCFRKMLEWKAKTFADPMYDWLKAERDQHPAAWASAAQMPHGDWATGHVSIAMNAGASKQGNPVKIERIGAYDIAGIEKQLGGNEKLAQFYLGLVEHLAHRLDHQSLQEGRLQQTYEIFDLAGLSWSIVSMGAINFTKDVLLAFSTHYPSSFRKACIINAPSFIGWLWGMFSKVLPASVNAKVNILGKDYERVLQEDLTPEALAWVKSSHAALVHAPHPIPHGFVAGGVSAPK